MITPPYLDLRFSESSRGIKNHKSELVNYKHTGAHEIFRYSLIDPGEHAVSAAYYICG